MEAEPFYAKPHGLHNLQKLLKDRRIKVVSINEPLDDIPTGHLTEGMIEAIDQFYIENIGEDIKRGLR